jgi:hypothetical protein
MLWAGGALNVEQKTMKSLTKRYNDTKTEYQAIFYSSGSWGHDDGYFLHSRITRFKVSKNILEPRLEVC